MTQERAQMLSAKAWSRLIAGLNAATTAGRLKWQAYDRRYGTPTSAVLGSGGILNFLNRPKVFRASSSGTWYEISSEDAYGRAPYELKIWEYDGTKTNSIGAVKSSTAVSDAASFEVNQGLEQLFAVVDGSVESEDEIVDRLLRGIPPE
jgi:hypothetical protein